MKQYVYEERKIGRYKVKVVQDNYAENPREWENLGTMICFHRRYNLGDKHSYSSSQDETFLALKKRKDVYWLPVYLYDHSGLTVNTTGFSCPWDSGQVGIIYMTRKDYLNAFNVKKVDKKKLYKALRSEVQDFDDYLTGNVYGYIVEDEKGEHVDSCWNFFGDGGMKDCLAEGIGVAEYNIKQDIKQHIKKVKTWIRNKVPFEKRTPLKV